MILQLKTMIAWLLSMPWKIFGWVATVASGEFFLNGRPNGGDVVLLRSVWISIIVFAVAVGGYDRLDPTRSWTPDLDRLPTLALEHYPWFGAIFAATYAMLYTRFGAQWSYLAGMYNQLMATKIQAPASEKEGRDKTYAAWWAAFIEDAEDVHLALKPAYAAVIAGLLGHEMVCEAYISGTVRGEKRIKLLEKRLRTVLGEEAFEKLKTKGAVKSQRPGPPPLSS